MEECTLRDTHARQGTYWRQSLRLTAILLLVWAAASFLPGWYAVELNAIKFQGWPLGFYMEAQGCLIIFLLIVWLYDRWMVRIERRHGYREED